MLEVEVKYRLADPAAARGRLLAWGAVASPTTPRRDHYLNAPDRDFARTDEALRAPPDRRGQLPHLQGPAEGRRSKTRTEVEVALPGRRRGGRSLLEAVPVARVPPRRRWCKKRRRIYEWRRDGFAVHACVDDVEGVGRFVELEIVVDDAEYAAARDTVLRIAAELALGPTEPRSYLEQLLAGPLNRAGSRRSPTRKRGRRVIAEPSVALAYASGSAGLHAYISRSPLPDPDAYASPCRRHHRRCPSRRGRRPRGRPARRLRPDDGGPARRARQPDPRPRGRSATSWSSRSSSTRPSSARPRTSPATPGPSTPTGNCARHVGDRPDLRPAVEEMYPPNARTVVEVHGPPGQPCAAQSGPGHFRGVATVVLKLFNIVRPDVAYFGQKDAQQALIIRRMVDRPERAAWTVRVRPTVREPDGLAMCSRNRYLDPVATAPRDSPVPGPESRRGLVAGGERSVAALEAAMAGDCRGHPGRTARLRPRAGRGDPRPAVPPSTGRPWRPWPCTSAPPASSTTPFFAPDGLGGDHGPPALRPGSPDDAPREERPRDEGVRARRCNPATVAEALADDSFTVEQIWEVLEQGRRSATRRPSSSTSRSSGR